MITSEFSNVHIRGICCALPTKHIVNLDEYGERFGVETVSKNSAMTGIYEGYMTSRYQTVSDLCFEAAKKLLNEKDISPSSIDILLFCSYNRDYVGPSTAYVLQHRLNLPLDCVTLDIPLGCSGFVYGMQVMGSLLSCSNAMRGLLLVGDSSSKCASPLDKSRMLFGDAGAAILVEKQENSPVMRFALRNDGNRFRSIITPAGADRVVEGASRERVLQEDENIRSDYDMSIRGMDVFNFAITDVPKLILEFMHYYEYQSEDFDYLLLHQANLFIIKHLAKKLKFPMSKVPISLDRYANSSGTTIPVTICDTFGEKEPRHIHALRSGFGVGLSWGVATIDFDTADVLPIFHTDEFYKEAVFYKQTAQTNQGVDTDEPEK